MKPLSHWRNWFAVHLGINQDRKLAVYFDLLRSVSLRDASYWLQVIFSAGIATLGLVLNSPAVIIGAMLISPLMGTILATGLAFAAGDLVLAIRAVVSLNLSCWVAILFATLLISILPFKELTPEIAARTNPNALDLVIALFSGALGAIATCKEPKGVVTSVPGVAIAVALMPPLCVVGYGIGVSQSLDFSEGMRVAGGGGLLLLTNLSAITFIAMLIFLLLNIDTPEVKEQVRQWHHQDAESRRVQILIERFPISNRWEVIGSLRSRLFVILVPLLVLLIPLSRALGRLEQGIVVQQRENQIRQVATNLWRQDFSEQPDGELRSYIDQLSSQEQQGRLTLRLTVFTRQFYSEAEQQTFTQRLSDRLNRPADNVILQLVQIPTASSEALAMLLEDSVSEQTAAESRPLTVAEARAKFLQTTDAALQSLTLPPPATLVRYEVLTNVAEPLKIRLIYLSEREIEADGKNLLRGTIRERLSFPTATVELERLVSAPAPLTLGSNQVSLTAEQKRTLGPVGQTLERYPNLSLRIVSKVNEKELFVDLEDALDLHQQRFEAIKAELTAQWQISVDRLTLVKGQNTSQSPQVGFRFTLTPSVAEAETPKVNPKN
ncbi:hypothetical protein C1752_01213 [Acaryochloris thomasi RCC1774]|uniref:TIGR00341 family protein n=1 Tax=Acaryochloris thomasi RCC1774 TaxID=1764569 RepID=A0A2W1JL29_9CYAN|nr:DUF389 domain-containing protein [Acaryochloris thomasi]PZD74103.1 hypothetical protein C1752_01213 [Acaryochloris thomasi RCC1774]